MSAVFLPCNFGNDQGGFAQNLLLNPGSVLSAETRSSESHVAMRNIGSQSLPICWLPRSDQKCRTYDSSPRMMNVSKKIKCKS